MFITVAAQDDHDSAYVSCEHTFLLFGAHALREIFMILLSRDRAAARHSRSYGACSVYYGSKRKQIKEEKQELLQAIADCCWGLTHFGDFQISK